MSDVLFMTNLFVAMMVVVMANNGWTGLLPQVGQPISNPMSAYEPTDFGQGIGSDSDQVNHGVQCRPQDGPKSARFMSSNVVQDQQTVTYCKIYNQLGTYGNILDFILC